jgi:pimeloyl-ACP methyl ester carboxylesterase
MSAIPIAMPRLGMTMEEGTVVEWPVPMGARVEKGQVVLVIETEKAESEIEATASGTLRHVFAEPGETRPCGALLAVLTDEPDEDFDPESFERAYVPPPGSGGGQEEVEAAAPAADTRAPAGETRAPASRKAVAPAARALAKKLGIDLASVEGSGPGGRVTRADVEAAATRRERLVRVEPGVGLEVLREGQGDPVVLLPGFGSDVSSFALQVPALARGNAVIGVNPRGVAGSDAPADGVYPVARAADDVAAVLADVPRAHVIGASLGAATALELALRHPDRVRSLTLITPFLEATPRLVAFAAAWTRLAEEASPEAIAAFLAPWLFGNALLADDAARARTLRGLAQSVRRIPAATLARTAAGMQAWSGTRNGDLEKIEVPTLVLAAGDDLLTPDAEGVAARVRGARCVSIPGAGHALAIDAADAVTREIRAHLEAAA